MHFIKSKRNYIYNLILFLIPILIIWLTVQFTSNNGFYSDDAAYSYRFTLKESLIYIGSSLGEHSCGYLGWFLDLLFSFFLPLKLSIHPSDFIGIPHSVIKGIFLTINIFIMAKFAISHYKSKSFYILNILFVFWYLIYTSYLVKSGIFDINYAYYRYCFSLIFYGAFWYYIYQNVIKKRKINYFYLMCISVCGFITGTSSEICIFSSLFFIGILFLHNLFVKLIFFKNNNWQSKLKFNLDKNFYIPAIFLYYAAYLFTNNGEYKFVANERKTIFDSLGYFCNEFTAFLKDYFNLYIQNNWLYYILFILLILGCFYFAKKRNRLQVIIFNLYFLISANAVIISLITCGRTFYDGISFWLVHGNILFIYRIIIILPFLSLLSYFLSNIKGKYKKIILNSICSFILLLFVIFKFPAAYNQLTYQNEFISNEYKVKAYIIEKIMLNYMLKNEIPIIPNENKINNGLIDVLQYYDRYNENCYSSEILRPYFFSIYNLDYKDSIEICAADDAIEKFYERGGTFYDGELQNIKFQRLLDKDFILNNQPSLKDRQITPSEIYNILKTD